MFFLHKQGIDPVLLNPAHSKRARELRDNSPNKTDRKDPKVLVDLLMMGFGSRVVLPEGKLADLRVLVGLREELLDDIKRTKNRLEAHLAGYFPEYWKLMRGLGTVSSRQILAQWPSPDALAEAGPEAIGQLLRRVSRGKLGAERARALWQAARDTVGIPEGREAAELATQTRMAQVMELLSREKQLCSRIQALLAQLPRAALLQSMPGIGIITSAILLGELGDLSRYRTQDEVLKMAGLNLYECSSGRHQGRRHITKRGRPLVRKALYMATLNMVKTGGVFHQVYRDHRKKGMAKVKALVAVGRKLLATLYAMVRDGTVWAPAG